MSISKHNYRIKACNRTAIAAIRNSNCLLKSFFLKPEFVEDKKEAGMQEEERGGPSVGKVFQDKT